MKKYRVKIWGKPLLCPVCQQDIFFFKKVEIVDHDRVGDHEISYLFECEYCGYEMLFGGDKVAAREKSLDFKLEDAQ